MRLAPLNRFKPSSKIFYWPFQGGTSLVDLLCFCSVLCLLCFVRVCLYMLCGHLLGKGWPLGSRLWCLLWVCHFPIGILGQVWYLIVSIPDLCNLTYFKYFWCICYSHQLYCFFIELEWLNTRTHSMARHRRSPHSQRYLTVIDPLTPSQGHRFDHRLKIFSVFWSNAHPLKFEIKLLTPPKAPVGRDPIKLCRCMCHLCK